MCESLGSKPKGAVKAKVSDLGAIPLGGAASALLIDLVPEE